MTDQTGSRPGGTRPTPYNEASGYGWDIVKAEARYEELTDRDLYARSRADLEERGEYDLAKHGAAIPEPLTLSERLELLANGEVLARYYRHPAMLNLAVQAGASWEQMGAACGTSAEQVRQEYREWAEGQHDLWTGRLGGKPGRFGLDDTAYAAAIARAGLADGLLAPDADSPGGPYVTEGEAREAAARAGVGELCTTAGKQRMLYGALKMAGVSLGTYDRQIIEWLSGWERATCAVIAGLVDRACEAGASRALQAYRPEAGQ